MADSLLAGHTQLTQKLTEIVENFTLLDILSKEEQEALLTGKIDKIRQENEKRLLRHQEIEADREQALTTAVEPRSPQEHQRLERQSSSGSSKKSPKSSPTAREASTGRGGYTGRGGVPTGRGSGHTRGIGRGAGGGSRRGTNRGRHSSSSSSPRSEESSPTGTDYKMTTSYSRRQVSSVEPVPGMLQPNTLDIVLHNTGKGLGFGIIGTPAGVNIKTIVEDGAAAMEGTLRTGDTLLFVNDVDVRCMARDEVFDILRRETGEVHLVVSRDDAPSPVTRGPTARRNDGHTARGYNQSQPVEGLRVTIPNHHVELADARTVHSGPKSLTVSVPNERAQGFVGRGRGRGRGMMEPERTVNKLTAEQIRQQEFEDRRQQNIDLVEAEIKAMREAYESQKAAEESGANRPPPGPAAGGFLYDRSRFDPDLPQGTGPRDGRRRDPHNWGGSTIEEVQQNVSRARRGRQQQFSGGQPTKAEMATSMTGRERRDYDQWRTDREKADQQRMARHVGNSGEWRREWDRDKPVPAGRQDQSHAEGHQVSHHANRGSRHSVRGQGYVFRGGGRGHHHRGHDRDSVRGQQRGRGYRGNHRGRRPTGPHRISIPTGKGEVCLSPLSNTMDQWEPSGGEDWETAVDKILAESPQGPQGELWKPSPNQDPLSGPIGTWEPLEEERQWEEDMENNKMSIGEKVKHWQDFGFPGPMPLDQQGNLISPTELHRPRTPEQALKDSTTPSPKLRTPNSSTRLRQPKSSLIPLQPPSSTNPQPLPKTSADESTLAKTLVENNILAAGEPEPTPVYHSKGELDVVSELVEKVDIGETVTDCEESATGKKGVKLTPLIIPDRQSNPMSPTSPLSAGSLKTPTDLVADWSMTPTENKLNTLTEESGAYQYEVTE